VLPLTGSFTVTLPVHPPLEIEVSPALEIPCLATDVIEVTAVNGGNESYTYDWTSEGSALGNTESNKCNRSIRGSVVNNDNLEG
jgi:hypothetical protein